MPRVTVALRVDAAARPLGFTTPPAPKVPLTLLRRLGRLDALELWLFAVGLFLCSLGVAAAISETFDLDVVPEAPQAARSWLQHAIASVARLEPPPPPPPLPTKPAGLTPQTLPLLCGALLLLIASHTSIASRRLTAMLLALWAAAQAFVAVRALCSESAPDAVRRLRFHAFVAGTSMLSLYAAPIAHKDSDGIEPTGKEVLSDWQSPAEAFTAEFHGTEETYR
jgi:hypothetical protein